MNRAVLQMSMHSPGGLKDKSLDYSVYLPVVLLVFTIINPSLLLDCLTFR